MLLSGADYIFNDLLQLEDRTQMGEDSRNELFKKVFKDVRIIKFSMRLHSTTKPVKVKYS